MGIGANVLELFLSMGTGGCSRGVLSMGIGANF